MQWADSDSEITGLSEFIVSEINKGVIGPADILILTPRRKIGYRLRDSLLRLKVPVKSYFRESVIGRPEVQRAFSLMNFLANPDDKISLRFLLGYNHADFRRNQYLRLKELANEQNSSIKDILDSILKGDIPETHLKSIVDSYRNILVDIPNLRNEILEDTENGFYNFFVTDDQLEDDFYELDQVYRNVVSEVGTEELDDPESFNNWFRKVMSALLETIALPDTPESINHARIMSLHSSKGLSAKLVILASLIDPLVPFLKRDLPADQVELTIQEARRLFYVAITRCKSTDNYDGRLVISSFLSIPGVEAVRMGIPANPEKPLRTRTTRFVNDFGEICPAPIRGNKLK